MTLQKWFPHTKPPFIANAPMFGFADVTLATAVTKANGFGFIGGGFDFRASSTQLKNLETSLEEARSNLGLTSHEVLPLGVGFITFQPSGFTSNAIPILRKNRVGAVWLSFPQADEDHDVLIRAIREDDWGAKVFVQVGTVRGAEVAVGQGVDGLVVQGTDAGGHQWVQGAGLVSVVPEVRDLVERRGLGNRIVVLAAGGIVDGRGVVAALGLGADGVVMGTRFLVTSECPAPATMKQTIVSSSDGGVSTVKSVRHDIFQSTDVFPRQYDGRAVIGVSYEDSEEGVSDEEVIRRYNEARKAGEDQRRTVWAGASVGSINEVVSVDDLVKTTQQEVRMIMERIKTGL